MNNENEEYRQKLNEIIIAKRQELRQNRLNSLKTLRSNKKSSGELATTTTEILYK